MREIMLLQKINQALRYFHFEFDRYLKYDWQELGELTTVFEDDRVIEFDVKTELGTAWLQIDKATLKLIAIEYTYKPANEFYLSNDDNELYEFLDGLEE